MHTSLVFLMLLEGSMIPRAERTPELAVQVEVSASVLCLPCFPATVIQARGAQGDQRSFLTTSIADIERELERLYRANPQDEPLQDLRIPMDRAEEVRFLESLLHDDQVTAMEERFLIAWNEWQDALVHGGAAEAADDRPSTAASGSLKVKTQDVSRACRLSARSAELSRSEACFAGFVAQSMTNGPGCDPAFQLNFDTDSRNKVEATKVRARIVRKQAPELASLWNPMAELLNQQAIRLMELETTVPAELPGSLRTLRSLARIRFLERFRRELWVCAAVWSQIASEAPPVPLKALEVVRK